MVHENFIKLRGGRQRVMTQGAASETSQPCGILHVSTQTGSAVYESDDLNNKLHP